jgi:hypothetical protein
MHRSPHAEQDGLGRLSLENLNDTFALERSNEADPPAPSAVLNPPACWPRRTRQPWEAMPT